jgi:predicted nucleotidyltransferase component of viral defense system
MFLHAVNNTLLSLIDRLAQVNAMAESFYLAGGTALALQLGHRISVDLDFFTQKPFQAEMYENLLIEKQCRIISSEQGTIHAYHGEAKLSLISYPYPCVAPFVPFRGINLAAVQDIACMKAVAISQRSEKKDFYDMYELMQHLGALELKELFLSKYSSARINCYHILKSFFFFDEADKQPDPLSLNGARWPEVRQYFLDREEELMRDMLCL